MKHSSIQAISIALAAASTGSAESIARRSISGTSTVNLADKIGPAEFLGSGFLYGIPDNGVSADSSVPDEFFTGINFKTCRGGGGQVDAVGWATGGYNGYIGRFQSALSNYRTTRNHGGDFILMASDMWGAQGGATAEYPFPGDNGNWTEMEIFLGQVISDIKANDMLDGLILDLWNEPDLETFWYPAWSQYVEYIVRATKYVRSNYPGLPVEFPSAANSPSEDSDNWNQLFAAVAANDVVPDRYSWHQIGDWQREPDVTVPSLTALRAVHFLPERPIDVNEYAWPSEQNPANSVYYISQFERWGIRALRANWGGGSDLHNYMANLIWTTSEGVYYPNGDWQAYKYYGSMVGERIATKASDDLKFDSFAVVSGDGLLQILAGTRTVQQAYQITITGLSEYGLATEGSLNIRTLRFDWSGSEVEVGDPVDLGSATYTYSSNELTITFDPPSNSTAFAFEIQLS
ncbi:glycoside hydrolase family 39 protein [Penicillium nucicola]|uniref:glycoside hydrolase family 39 protein n=1 Tax=Penicillium nucicola TaxID=1850975 RepID=UPI0025450F99|nr:glycoside hydrolase family 39 protein [Penicillium nucicola]KAJ5758215.1 glycoside hydrolase family 39 protein [Penicillium nucicola]